MIPGGWRTAILPPGAIAVLLALVGSAAAEPPRIGPLVRLSGASPHAERCPEPGGRTTAQLGAEVEPHLAVDPRRPRRLLATWQQDRYRDGSAISSGARLSEDGGRTFRRVRIPGMTDCPEPPLTGIGDPWTSFDRAGRAYKVGLAFGTGPVGVDVSHSTSSPRSWARETTTLIDPESGFGFPDKPVIVADPGRTGHVYAAWVRNSAIPSPLGTIRGVRAPVMVSRSVDGGSTWTDASVAYTPPDHYEPDFVSGMLLLDDGSILILLVEGGDLDSAYDNELGQEGPGDTLVRVIRSSDEGITWSAPTTVATLVYREIGPDGAFLRHGALPTAAAGPDGAVHVAWPDARGDGSIAIASSTDGGITWGNPHQVVEGHRPIMPALAVSSRGTVGVLYNDFRADVAGDGRADAAVRLAFRRRGETRWRDLRVSPIFDARKGPRSGFLGDYQGLVDLRNGFGSLFAAAPPVARRGLSDIFFRRLRVDR